MKFFSAIGKVAKTLVQVSLPVAIAIVSPGSVANVVLGAVVKHGARSRKLNQAIPFLSMIGSIGYQIVTSASEVGTEAAVTSGITQASMAWAAHRALKEPTRAWVKNPALATKVGPGERFSL